MSEKARSRAMHWLVTIGFFLLWEILCVLTGVQAFILPRPSLVFVTMVKFAPQILHHSLWTLYTTTAGFAIGVVAGALLGIFIGASLLTYVIGRAHVCTTVTNAHIVCCLLLEPTTTHLE